MKSTTSSRRYMMAMTVWTLSAIIRLTVAVVAVGLLGLWVAVGAIGGLGATVVCGWLGQVLFATDVDDLLARRGGAHEGDDTAS